MIFKHIFLIRFLNETDLNFFTQLDSFKYCNITEEHFLFSSCVLYWKVDYHDQKIWQPVVREIRNHWTSASTLLGLISRVYCNLHHWSRTSNHRMQCQSSTIELLVHIAHSDAKLTSHGNYSANYIDASCKLHPNS